MLIGWKLIAFLFFFSRTADGITRGSYSYIDSNGIVQQVNYQADPVNGFRVAASNLPLAPVAAPVAPVVAAAPALVAPVPVQDTPEVVAARAEHLAAKAVAEATVVEAPLVPAEPVPAVVAAVPETPEVSLFFIPLKNFHASFHSEAHSCYSWKLNYS